ncbi:5512_t:CDS:2, partial [Scutellospora calospora]
WYHLLELEKYICLLEVELAKDINYDSKKDFRLFEEATQYLGGSNYATYSTLNPIMIHIINKLKPILQLSEEINIESIKDIFSELEICDDKNNLDKPMQTFGVLEKVKEILYYDNKLYLPSILDPQVKKFDFASDKIKQVQDLLKTKYHNAKDKLLLISTTMSSTTSYWNQNAHRFPVLSKLAQSYLAVSATSTPSE